MISASGAKNATAHKGAVISSGASSKKRKLARIALATFAGLDGSL